MRETELRLNQPGCLVKCIVGAMTVAELGRIEPLTEVPNQLFNCHALYACFVIYK